MGPEDWLEFDVDELNRDRRGRILDLVLHHRVTIEGMLGDAFDTVVRPDGTIGLVVAGVDVATVSRSIDDRLELTRVGSDRPYL